MFAFVNDRFAEEEFASIGVGDLAIQRGYGVFDFFRTRNFQPLFLDEYLDRLFYSAETFRLEIPYTKTQIASLVQELSRRNDIEPSGVRIVVTGGYSEDSYRLAESNFIITQKPITLPGNERFNEGLKIITYNYQREFPTAKSINYLVGIYLLDQLAQQGADEVLYTFNGNVLEFPRANVFVVTKDQKVITPKDNVLHGVTRKKVLELSAHRYSTEERNVTIDELNNATEIFLTSTTKRILPVVRVNDMAVANGIPGAVTKQLYQDFLALENSL